MFIPQNWCIIVNHSYSHKTASFQAIQIHSCTKTLWGRLCRDSTVL